MALADLMDQARLVLEGNDAPLIQEHNDALAQHVDGARHEGDGTERQLGADLRDLRADLAQRYTKLQSTANQSVTEGVRQKPTYPTKEQDPMNNWPMNKTK